jgi:hypothetical protein
MSFQWPDNSYGEDENSEPQPSAAINPQQFTPDKSVGSDLSQHEHANRVNRIVSTYMASSPEQRHAGNRWYSQAHRAATTVAKGEDPGIGFNTPAMKRGVYRPPSVSGEDVRKQSGVIAALSPAMPAGMTWKENPRAAYELNQASDSERDRLAHQGERASTPALKHAGGAHVKTANRILDGEDPEETFDFVRQNKSGAPMPDAHKKRGAFYRNIADPSNSTNSTVDFRSAGIAAHFRSGTADISKDLGTLSGQRYKDYEGAHQEATDVINQHLAQAGTPQLQPHQVQATTWLADQNAQEYGGSNKSTGGGRKGFRTPFGQERTG